MRFGQVARKLACSLSVFTLLVVLSPHRSSAQIPGIPNLPGAKATPTPRVKPTPKPKPVPGRNTGKQTTNPAAANQTKGTKVPASANPATPKTPATAAPSGTTVPATPNVTTPSAAPVPGTTNPVPGNTNGRPSLQQLFTTPAGQTGTTPATPNTAPGQNNALPGNQNGARPGLAGPSGTTKSGARSGLSSGSNAGSFAFQDYLLTVYGCTRGGTTVLCDFDLTKSTGGQPHGLEAFMDIRAVGDGGEYSPAVTPSICPRTANECRMPSSVQRPSAM